jgi:hypothetical protein
MSNLEILKEELSQQMDIETDDMVADTVLVPLRILMDTDTTSGEKRLQMLVSSAIFASLDPYRGILVNNNGWCKAKCIDP